jgi:hypothetical protein
MTRVVATIALAKKINVEGAEVSPGLVLGHSAA